LHELGLVGGELDLVGRETGSTSINFLQQLEVLEVTLALLATCHQTASNAVLQACPVAKLRAAVTCIIFTGPILPLAEQLDAGLLEALPACHGLDLTMTNEAEEGGWLPPIRDSTIGSMDALPTWVMNTAVITAVRVVDHQWVVNACTARSAGAGAGAGAGAAVASSAGNGANGDDIPTMSNWQSALRELTIRGDADLVELLVKFGPALATLNLSGCKKLSALPESLFVNCTALTTLNLSGCWNLDFHESIFANCPALVSLDLSNCTKLSALPESIFAYCPALATLSLKYCSNLSVLAESVFDNCHALATLILEECRSIYALPVALFANCPALATLDLGGCNNLSALPEALFSNCAVLDVGPQVCARCAIGSHACC
jgi:hypothetical protein